MNVISESIDNYQFVIEQNGMLWQRCEAEFVERMEIISTVEPIILQDFRDILDKYCVSQRTGIRVDIFHARLEDEDVSLIAFFANGNQQEDFDPMQSLPVAVAMSWDQLFDPNGRTIVISPEVFPILTDVINGAEIRPSPHWPENQQEREALQRNILIKASNHIKGGTPPQLSGETCNWGDLILQLNAKQSAASL